MRFALALLLLPALSSATPRPIVMPDADATVPVFQGQLHLALPVMKRVDGDDWQDRAVFTLDHDEAELTLVATDTYATAGNRFRDAVAADLKRQGVRGAKLQPIALAKPLFGIEVLPAIPKSSFDRTVFLYGVYIARPDASVLVLSFMLSTNALRDSVFWRAQARRIAATAVAGTPSRDMEPMRVAVKTPATWRTSQQLSGNAFEVRLREVAPLGKPGARCLIRLLAGPADILPPGKRVGSPSRGTFLSYEVTWTDFALDDGDAFTVVTDQRVPNSINELVDDVRSEVWCRAPDAGKLPALRAMIESSELVKRK